MSEEGCPERRPVQAPSAARGPRSAVCRICRASSERTALVAKCQQSTAPARFRSRATATAGHSKKCPAEIGPTGAALLMAPLATIAMHTVGVAARQQKLDRGLHAHTQRSRPVFCTFFLPREAGRPTSSRSGSSDFLAKRVVRHPREAGRPTWTSGKAPPLPDFALDKGHGRARGSAAVKARRRTGSTGVIRGSPSAGADRLIQRARLSRMNSRPKSCSAARAL